ncbi:MAG TPA: hypothetical protein VD793_00910 [Gemmatimonadales bacterium]|nr:hypothetical protein [Gemmatimonadales bacterium]
MQPYDRVTILRNRYRARDLRIFRARVQGYFELLAYESENQPADWEALRAARAEINQLLPRVIQIVKAADLGGWAPASGNNPAGRAMEILQNIFSPRYGAGTHEEILDVIDMAVGVYDANRLAAFGRTINPLHYVLAALGFVAGLPRRALVAIGVLNPRALRIRPQDLDRFESALKRLGGAEELIDARFAELREWHSRLSAEQANQMMELAERMDFLERVLAQQRPAPSLKPGEKKATPV